jgi:hypothetical protein
VRGTWQGTVKYQQVCKSWSTSVEVLALWGTGGEFWPHINSVMCEQAEWAEVAR